MDIHFLMMIMMNFYINAQAKTWKKEQNSVDSVALFPTPIYITNKFYCSIETLHTNIFRLYKLFIYANLCWDEGNLTYDFFIK